MSIDTRTTIATSSGGHCDCCNGSSGSAGLQCSTRGGTAILCGFPEYASPSSPAKFYRKKAFSGVVQGQTYGDTLCIDVGAGCLATDTYSGALQYSSTDCSLSGAPQFVRTGDCPTNGIYSVTDISAFLGDTIVLTQTEKTMSNDLECHLFATGSFRRPSNPTVKLKLEDEDLDSDAITRLLGSSDWSEYVNTVQCGSVWGPRIGLTIPYIEARFRVLVGGLTSGVSYVLSIDVYRRPFDTGDFTLYQTIEYPEQGVADDGTFTLDDNVPIDQGYETLVTNPRLTAV